MGGSQRISHPARTVIAVAVVLAQVPLVSLVLGVLALTLGEPALGWTR